MTACKYDRPPEWIVEGEAYIVDVDDMDWPRHPAWLSDFDAEEMRLPSLKEMLDGAGVVVAVRRTY